MLPLRLAHQMERVVLVSQALVVQEGWHPQRRQVVRAEGVDRAQVAQVVRVGRVNRARVVQVVQASRFLHLLNHLLKAPRGRPNHRPSLVALVVPSQVVPVGLQELRVAQAVPIQVVLVELVVSVVLAQVEPGA